MLTIFATPKRFEGHTGLIQRNAIASWMALRPAPEIILFGEDGGTAEICREFGLIHVPDIARTQFGAPLLPDLFEKAQRLGSNNLLSYVNADIILMSDFLAALNLARTASEKFLMVARVWRVRIDDPRSFEDADAETKLRAYVREYGRQSPPPGNSDFFAFPRDLWSAILPLGVGRGAWDPWLVYEARRLGAAVVDASPFLMAVHQNHDQSTYPHGLKRWRQEINHNFSLVSKEAASFCLYDATHVIDAAGLHRPHGMRYLSRYIDTLPEFHPALGLPLRIPKAAIDGVRRIRRRVAEAQDPKLRLVKLVRSKLPSDGVTAILGLNDRSSRSGEPARGLNLALALLMVGHPVVAYDPDSSVMGRARQIVGGPFEFADSAEACVAQADVVVIASAREEFRRVPLLQHLSNATKHRVVIDCCETQQEDRARLQIECPGLEYISWVERG
ncbi:MAG: hypothetical protein WA871_14130 [Candidatus Acidiferrales bacterium]